MDDLLPTEETPNPPPTVLKNRYELRQILGEGGMGRVYRAFDRVLGRTVAVKLLTDLESPMIIQRFEREARTLSQLNHPNLAAVHDYGMEGTQPFMVMEFIEGKSLAKLIAEKESIEPELALDLIAQIGAALGAAHEQGIVHRDIKPENILVTFQNGKNRVEIVDFGLAISDTLIKTSDRLTMPGFVVGTQRYMAPEQMEGKSATVATDLYAFGLVCAEMLAGLESVKAGRLRATVAVKPDIAQYWPVIERACRDEPSERWPDAHAMVEAFQKTSPVVLTPWENAASTRRTGKTHRIRQKKRLMQAVTFLFIFLALGLSSSVFWWDAVKGRPIVPVVIIQGVSLTWKSARELEVKVSGDVRSARSQRMLLEVAACDEKGNRIPAGESALVDRALGALQAVDVFQSPQRFEKTFSLHMPDLASKGYVSATFFDAHQIIVARQNSGFWTNPPRKALR